MKHGKPEVEEPKPYQLDLAHISMQYSDTKTQKHQDASTIFSQGYNAMTGTEAGQDDMKAALRVYAHKYDYAVHIGRANWVAVQKKLILPRSYKKGHELIVDNDDLVGKSFSLHLTWVQWEMREVGVVTLASGHYATKGRPVSGELGVNREANRDYALRIDEVADRLGRGKKLFFYGGDQNIPDDQFDTFFGGDLTSAGDELDKHPGTGHGPIDVIASLDQDHRVEAKYFRAKGDKKLFLHSDHKAVEAGFLIKRLDS